MDWADNPSNTGQRCCRWEWASQPLFPLHFSQEPGGGGCYSMKDWDQFSHHTDVCVCVWEWVQSEHLASVCSPTLVQTRESVDYWMQLQCAAQTIKIDRPLAFYHTPNIAEVKVWEPGAAGFSNNDWKCVITPRRFTHRSHRKHWDI